MSGHSKWHNIRVKKLAQDAARGKIYTRHARLIEIAARAGGGDPVVNTQLRTAIENAKVDSVPNANIERAVGKGTGAFKGEAMQELVYEAYLPIRSSAGAKGGGPGGVAFIVECLSDNRNRTLANVKTILGKNGGRLADTGAVQFLFERKGLVVAERTKDVEQRTKDREERAEELELQLIDFGAEDISLDDDVTRVTTSTTEWPRIRDFLKGQGWKILSAGLSSIPKQKVNIADPETAKKLSSLMDALDQDDDVSAVHTNADLTAEVAAQLT
jgi:YebC/PmpR family DNA-binding regulatory protein